MKFILGRNIAVEKTVGIDHPDTSPICRKQSCYLNDLNYNYLDTVTRLVIIFNKEPVLKQNLF